MSGENGKDPEVKRKAFKAGERQKHLELLAKNVLLEEDLKDKLKRVKEARERCAQDIRAGGYVEQKQGELGIDPDDEDDAHSRA